MDAVIAKAIGGKNAFCLQGTPATDVAGIVSTILLLLHDEYGAISSRLNGVLHAFCFLYKTISNPRWHEKPRGNQDIESICALIYHAMFMTRLASSFSVVLFFQIAQPDRSSHPGSSNMMLFDNSQRRLKTSIFKAWLT